MNLDRDLRDALSPLGGDPVADAERVLAALRAGPVDSGPSDSGPRTPRKGTPQKGLPKIGWWLLGTVLAAGIATGYLLGRLGDSTPAAVPQPNQQKPPDQKPPDQKPPDQKPPDQKPPDEKPPDEKPTPMPSPREMEGYLQVMAFGELVVSEPKTAQETLTPGSWQVAAGTLFETNKSMAGIYLFANDVRVRLAQRTIAAVQIDRITLREGQLWLANSQRPAPMRIEAEFATVAVDAAVVLVERNTMGVAVTVLDGSAAVLTARGESRTVAAMQRVEVDQSGRIAEIAIVPFAGTVTGWMAPMVLQQQDESELQERIAAMVDAYREGTHRAAAALELRRLGARAVPRLFESLDAITGDVDLLHATAALIGDLADYSLHEWLLAMVERGDAETRVSGFVALDRVTGTKIEDEAFWRSAPPEQRDTAVARWRALLRNEKR